MQSVKNATAFKWKDLKVSSAIHHERPNINPFTAPACKISWLKDERTHLKTVYFPVLKRLFSVFCVFMIILSHAGAKKKKKKEKKKA